VWNGAVLQAAGITPARERLAFGVSVPLSEHETHWKTFLQGFKDCGMKSMKLIISDDYSGLEAVRRAVLGSLPR
jgi:transposase-like protein